jgi:monofunctional biosynthetic peptidoglycan transglycosylase
MQKFLRRLSRVFLVLLVFLLLYTIYCLFSEPHLCDLATKRPTTTSFMEIRKEEWKERKLNRKVNQRWVPLSAISKNLTNAVVVSEDPNFYRHSGLDFYAIKLAVNEMIEEKEIVHGASTITQQLMKNLYLSSSQNPLRKWKEAILALRVERCVSKNRILEIYLNVIEWGEATYGIEAASRRYFGKSAASLTPSESAILAVMIPNPRVRNPSHWNSKLERKKNLILKQMSRLRK